MVEICNVAEYGTRMPNGKISTYPLLNEKQWRQLLVLEVKVRGNIVLVAQEAGISKNQSKKEGRWEIEAGDLFSQARGSERREEGKSSLSAITVYSPV